MKKLSFALGFFALVVFMASCSADDLELQPQTANKELLIDDFDYKKIDTLSETAKEGDNNQQQITIGADSITVNSAVTTPETDPVITPPVKKD